MFFHQRIERLSDQVLHFRLPERLAPGTFALWGRSHQVFHIAILGAFFSHVTALTKVFTAVYTLNVCEEQAFHHQKR